MKDIEQDLLTKIILETATKEDFLRVGDSYTYFEDLLTRNPAYKVLYDFGITHEVKDMSFQNDKAFILYRPSEYPEYVYGIFKYTGDPITFFHKGQILTS